MNRSNTSGLLTGTGAETVFDTTAAIAYEIDGKLYTKAAVTDGVTPVVDGNTGAAFTAVLPDKVCVFVWGYDAAGDVALFQGDIADVDGDTDAADWNPGWPSLPNTHAPFAYTIFQTDGTSAAGGLLIGTANWNATGLTATHTNISTIPGRPQA
jgi:hypothetical protein